MTKCLKGAICLDHLGLSIRNSYHLEISHLIHTHQLLWLKQQPGASIWGLQAPSPRGKQKGTNPKETSSASKMLLVNLVTSDLPHNYWGTPEEHRAPGYKIITTSRGGFDFSAFYFFKNLHFGLGQIPQKDKLGSSSGNKDCLSEDY